MIKSFIWDFDGTIFDSYRHSARAFRMILDKHGIPYEPERIMPDLRVTFNYAFEKYGLSEEQIAEFRAVVKDYNLKPLIMPYADTEYILKRVIECGCKNYIYTHRDSETLGYYLNKYGMSELFDECVTADYGFEKKPSPQGVRYIIDKYGLCAEETLMIGDRELDVRSGVDAGAYGCLLSEDAENTETCAQYVVGNLKEIERFLSNAG